MKKIISTIIAIAMMLGTMSFVTFAGEGDVAKIGDTGYQTFEAAIAAVQNGETIILLADCAENVTIKQVANVSFTIDGNNKKYTGTIIIDGGKRSAGVETLTITNVNFVAEGQWQSSISTVKRTFAHNLTIDNCTFTGNDAKQAYGIILRHAYNIVVKNTTGTNLFDLVYGNAAVTGFEAENVTVTNSTNGIWLSYVNSTATIDNLNADVSNIGVGIVNNAKGTVAIEDSTIKSEAPVYLGQNGGSSTSPVVLTVDGENSFTSTEENGAWLNVEGNNVAFTVKVNDTTLDVANTTGLIAANGTNYYNTLAEAVSKAAAGDTVKLLNDTADNDEVTVNNDIIIDLNGKILNGAIKPSTGDITVKNGTIINTNPDISGIEINTGNLTLTDVNINSARHAVRIDGDVEAVINGGTYKTIFVTKQTQHAVNVSGNATVTINDGIFFGPMGTPADSGSAVNAKSGATVTIENGKFSGGLLDTLAGVGTINVLGGFYDQNPVARIGGGKNLIAAASGDSAYPYVVVKEELATSIKLEFEEVAAKEGEKLYNINLVAVEGLINRLNTADLTFVLTQGSWGKNEYEVHAQNDEVVVNKVDENRYEFHYDGKDAVKTDSGYRINIGQVKFTGYGKFSFVVAEADTNVAYATTENDNIVDTFVPGGKLADGTEVGEFDVSDKTITDVEIKVPTRELVINIDFNNAVEAKEEDYQQMKVEVYGGDLEKKVEIKLADADQNGVNPELAGKADARYSVDASANEYAVTLSKVLTVNTTYNVKVEGAGYRDAYYTVTMNEDVQSKTLNFWNNVKDVAEEVEVNKPSSKKNVTFLAGDIVKDNIINIYDLSAVVSYFGETELVGNNNGYAKYDLNRDGKIDSKDVAYVLVSWGK